MTRHEADRARRRQGLPARVPLKDRHVVTRVCRRIPVYRVVVKDTQNLGHLVAYPLSSLWLGVSLTGSLIRAHESIFTTDLRTSPRFILSNAPSIPSSGIVSDTNPSRSRRPCR